VFTNLDMLYAVHSTLMTCLTLEEWHSLSEGLRVQCLVTEVYKERRIPGIDRSHLDTAL